MHAQGVMILAGAPDSALAYKRKAFYQSSMRGIVINWSNCSNQGEASFDTAGKDPFCMCALPSGARIEMEVLNIQDYFLGLSWTRDNYEIADALALPALPHSPLHIKHTTCVCAHPYVLGCYWAGRKAPVSTLTVAKSRWNNFSAMPPTEEQ